MDHIDLSERILSGVPNPLDPRFEEVILYGAGNSGKDLYRILKKSGKNVIAFLDQRAVENLSFEGVPILPPGSDKIDARQRKNALLVIAIFNRDVDIEPIVQLLRKERYDNIITFVQLHHYFSTELGDRFWLGNRALYPAHKSELEEVEHLMADEESRTIFRAIVEYRMTGDHRVLTKPEGMETQYFSKNLPLRNDPLRFIDAGAYDGDTLAAMAAFGIQSEAVAAFEPDIKNFKKLSDYCVKQYKKFTRQINLYPCAIWSKTEYLGFAADNNEGSHVNNQGGGTSVLAVSIDEILPSFNPNFIKMDIEGAEMEGLLGARQTILEHAPDLGICLYHTPDHLWSIPLLVKSWNLPYKFYLRAHANNGLELVLYAKA